MASRALLLAAALLAAPPPARAADAAALDGAVAAARKALAAKHPAEAARIERGVDQVRRLWRDERRRRGGVPRVRGRRSSCRAAQRSTPPSSGSSSRSSASVGYFTSLSRDLRRGVDLEIGPLLPLDERLAAFDPSAHVSDDLFGNKIAFVALLNFPLTTLDERLARGRRLVAAAVGGGAARAALRARACRRR